ncbi:MAG TPA: hypothetical protein VGN07_06990 [Steroidobacteraceae bacterium]|jgi:5'-nucleotidase
MMKRIVCSIVLSALACTAAQATTSTVKIIAFNDFHGNLQSPGSPGGAASGGIDYLAGYVTSLKAQNPNNVAQDIDALVAYLSSGFKFPNPPYDPAAAALNTPRIIRVP